MNAERDLFVVCETEDSYNMYHISLDDFEDPFSKQAQKFHFTHITTYPKELIENDIHNDIEGKCPLLGFYVRASSSKTMKKMMVFFLHAGSIWSWHE